MDITNLSNDLKAAIQLAQSIARDNTNEYFSACHLLKAMMSKDFFIRELFKSLGKDIYFIDEWAEVRIESYPKSSKNPEIIKGDKDLLSVMTEAENVKVKLGEDKVDLSASLIALCTPGVGFNYEQLKSFPVTPNEIIDFLVSKETLAATLGDSINASKERSIKNTALLKFTVDKIELARKGQLEYVIGRENEIRMITEVLNRRVNSNIILIGDPGVGKTSILNGFCHLVIDKNSPVELHDFSVFELSMGDILAGAAYKGEAEDRLSGVFKELKAIDNAFLIIEDIHDLLDRQGSVPGAANLLKQELSKGEIRLVVTTTIDNYTKIVEKDDGFKRFFEIVKVEETNDLDALSVLEKVIPTYYSTHHNLTISKEVLLESIRLTRRYIKERSLPSAAIDLIDRTMAVVKTAKNFTDQTLDEIEKELSILANDTSSVDSLERIRALQLQLIKRINPVVHAYLDEEIGLQDFSSLQEGVSHISVSIKKIRKLSLKNKESVEKNDIAAVVAQKTNIPIGKLQSGEREKLLNAEEYLTQRVIGQNHAIQTIISAILESRSGLTKAGQPIGSFFFLGPTGTGKTELAKTLAEFLFNDENALIRFDMSEFKEEHSAALLYGAPPGYVGYEQGGVLVNKIRQQPYSVVLFDEIEKAHNSVFDIFLQILDEGKLHDRLGKVGDFSNAVVIFTSNIGSKFIVDSFSKNLIPENTQLMEIMANHFRPEFLGRLTEIIPFSPITKDIAVMILDIHMKSLLKSLAVQKIELHVDNEAKEKLALMGFNPQYGARPLIGIIRSQLRRPLSKMIITGELKEGAKITLKLNDNNLDWKY